jgi:NAD(P)H-hydrate epimerase
MRILDTAQMREADKQTIDDVGVPSIVLMENAGRQVVSALEANYEEAMAGRVAVLCGRGSNGGDGFVVARTLALRGVDVSVFVLGEVASIKGDARVNLDILGRLGVDAVEIADEHTWELHASEVRTCGLIVDAIVGTGFNPPLRGLLETVVADLNTFPAPVVAIDLPTGVSADTPRLNGHAVQASMTVTLAAPKLPLVLPPAEDHAGDVVIADIGIPPTVVEGLAGRYVELVTPEQLRLVMQPRPVDSHKGDYGRVTVVAGSVGKSGAAYLTAVGALRSGAGLVTVATPRCCLPIVASLAPEYMTEGLDEEDGTVSVAAVDRVLALQQDIIACGPGLGRTAGARAFVRGLVERAAVPLLLDADAIIAFADAPDALLGQDGREIIVTPHPGEMAALTGLSVEDVQANRLDVACQFATDHHLYVVLKGHRTVVATPAGRAFINPTGNPGMATGGTGDVLSGMLAAWLAQLLDAEAACQLAVFLHGAAGDLAAAELGQVAMTAGDLLRSIGAATERLRVGPERTATA